MNSRLSTQSIQSSQGMELNTLNYGARILSLRLPIDNKKVDLVLAYPNLNDYLIDQYFMGASIGRYCNRIHGGEIRLNNKRHPLSINEPDHQNTLHGGTDGLDKRFWDCKKINEQCLEYSILSPHGDQGFPGNLELKTRYSLLKNYQLVVEFQATCDADTVLNLCNHTYFNLDGTDGSNTSSIQDHQLQIHAEAYLPITAKKVPTGKVEPVARSPFDFTQRKRIAHALMSDHPQLQLTQGIDHCYVLNNTPKTPLRLAARLHSRRTNISLSVSTTQAGMHVYTGNHLAAPFAKHTGICFETQGFPDAPNHPNFPSAVLKAGERYTHKTIYQFEVEEK